MENGSKAPKAIRMAPEGAPTPQGLALYVITEEIIVSLPALTHRQRGMIKIRGIAARCGALDRLLARIRSASARAGAGSARPGVAFSASARRRATSLRLRQTDWSPFWRKRFNGGGETFSLLTYRLHAMTGRAGAPVSGSARLDSARLCLIFDERDVLISAAFIPGVPAVQNSEL